MYSNLSWLKGFVIFVHRMKNFCVQQKWLHNVHFWVNYPFNFIGWVLDAQLNI